MDGVGWQVDDVLVKRLGHVRPLDGVRGVAILAVLLYHDGRLPGGWVGVDLFFVLSGFLITTLLLEERATAGGISLRRFYARRARRLLPVAIVGIILAEAMLAAVHAYGQMLVGLAALFYVENLAHFLHPPLISQLGHYWSLSEEEQFYFLWPPLLALLLARRTRLRWIVGGLVMLAIAVMMHRATLSDGWRLYGPDARSDGIMLGCALAVVRSAGWLRPWRWLSPIGIAGLAGFLYSSTVSGLPTLRYGITIANLAAVALIAAVVARPDSMLARVLSLPPLRWLGLISYSLYIWNSFVRTDLGLHGMSWLAVSLLVSAASYRFIERPFRIPRAPARLEPVAAAVAAPS